MQKRALLNTILQGDSLDVLKTLPSESINMCMTSPPYWALRDYGVKNQLGLEPTFEEYITKMCNVFDEVKRVLRKDGTCWVNYGDTYNTSHAVGTTDAEKGWKSPGNEKNPRQAHHGRGGDDSLPVKSLVMIPFRFAIEMVNRGWILRNTIIWHKPNPMPSSAKDRFTVDFEYLFFFSKSKKYWFEQQFDETQDKEYRTKGKIRPTPEGGKGFEIRGGLHKQVGGRPFRNTRCVWKIPTHPFPDAHFAVYPEKLCVTPIKAGCPEGGVVLDPFMGAGTTALVARKLGRNYLGIELNPEYIKIAEKRLQQKSLF